VPLSTELFKTTLACLIIQKGFSVVALPGLYQRAFKPFLFIFKNEIKTHECEFEYTRSIVYQE